MITFFDLVQRNDFRNFVSNRISNASEVGYAFPRELPRLYKYRSLSSYAVDDIINGKLSFSAIGEFNDIFDGAMHLYGSKQEIEKAAEAKWAEIERLQNASHFPEGLLRKESIVIPYLEYFKTQSRLKFRELDYLGTYVFCLSEEKTSTLMWAHYADSNKGICVEYDFNQLSIRNLLRSLLFPVAYTAEPINLSDLLADTGNQLYPYPLDAAVLCAALNKAAMWRYEKEWRMVFVAASSSEKERRLHINSFVQPSKVFLGYHFLKPFFYYNYRNQSEIDNCEERIRKFMELLSYLRNNSIPIAVMVPAIGSYQFIPCDIPTDELYEFMLKHFQDEQAECMRYYYTIHDCLMDLIEETQENAHV